MIAAATNRASTAGRRWAPALAGLGIVVLGVTACGSSGTTATPTAAPAAAASTPKPTSSAAAFPGVTGTAAAVSGSSLEVQNPTSGQVTVTFTGSTLGGRSVAATCGVQLKRVACELGGKSAAIFMPDADLDRFVPVHLGNCIRNVGQICISLSRVLVPRERQDDLVERIVASLSAMRIGDPHDRDTDIGPLAAERQRARVEHYIKQGIDEGAVLALGGRRPAGMNRGWYVEPTLFRDVDNRMTVAREEIFGPVICVIPYQDLDEAVSIANDSDYGLFGSVYSDDLASATAIARRLETGTCAVNDGPPSGGGGPFGGWKQSGVGRERAPEGLLEYLETRSIAMPTGARVPDPVH